MWRIEPLNWWFYRKGSEIWANHNRSRFLSSAACIGDSTAKVVKFEQITTVFAKPAYNRDWWFYRKGSEIWANHNRRRQCDKGRTIGDSTAKVVKFEQITTVGISELASDLLVILPQR